MTEAQQRRFYFPNWNGCAVANGWMMIRGRLRADLVVQREDYSMWPDPAKELYLKVVTTAEQLALQDHTAVNADHLRRACNWIASSGHHLSSSDLSNAETNRVVSLFKLLADPDDLDAVMNWLHPENAERGSFVAFLRKRANEAALIAISSNAYGTKHWEELPIEKLRWIAREVKNREPSRKTFYRRQLAAVELHSSGKQYDPANAAF